MVNKAQIMTLFAASAFSAAFYMAGNLHALAQSEQQRALSSGKHCLSQGKYKQAVRNLELAVKESPNCCEGYFLLGNAYCKLHNYSKAKEHYRKALKVGHGSSNAQKANQELFKLPRNLLAVKGGPQTRMIAAQLGIARERGAASATRATVLDFYATWCAPCKQLKLLIEKAKRQYGDKVAFMSIDVDDPDNQKIIDQYEVSPIPTLVFLNPEGEVVTYTIGFSGDNSVLDGIKKVLSREEISDTNKTRTVMSGKDSNRPS